MRVLMVSRGVLPIGHRSGGAELVAFELARHLALQGDRVTIVADIERPLWDNAPRGMSVRTLSSGHRYARCVTLIPFTFIRWMGQHLVGNARAALRAAATLEENDGRFDVVHSHGALATIMISRVMRRSMIKVPLIYTEHDSPPWTCNPRGLVERLVRRAVYRAINLRACRHATLVVTNFTSLAAELSQYTGLPPDHFVVAPNGADIKRFAPDETVERTVSANSRRHGLFVGSLIGRKAPDLLLHALAQARMDLGLVVVGEGPMASELRRLAKRLQIADRVLFLGAQPQSAVQRCYQRADFLVLPSVSEAAPLVIIEALSMGKPVIATDIAGIASVVRHRENGLLVPPGNVAALSAALDSLADAELHSYLAANAAASVRHLSWEVIARQISTLYIRASNTDRYATPAQRTKRRDLDNAQAEQKSSIFG